MQNIKPKNDKIKAICAKGYQLDFGTVFEAAFENYKKIALYAGLMLLVFSILISVVMIAGFISYIGIENMEEFGEKMKQYSSLKEMPLEIAIPLNASLLLFSGLLNPFMAGFFKMADCGEKGEEFNVSTMFSYYKFPYFLNIFLFVIVIGIINTGLAMLLQSAGLSFVGMTINLLISFLTFLAIPLIVFGNLDAINAIKYSIQLVLKQPLILLGLIIVGGIGSILGIFGLCIGVFFTLPFMYSMYYKIYRSIIGLEDTSEITQIGSVQD